MTFSEEIEFIAFYDFSRPTETLIMGLVNHCFQSLG